MLIKPSKLAQSLRYVHYVKVVNPTGKSLVSFSFKAMEYDRVFPARELDAINIRNVVNDQSLTADNPVNEIIICKLSEHKRKFHAFTEGVWSTSDNILSYEDLPKEDFGSHIRQLWKPLKYKIGLELRPNENFKGGFPIELLAKHECCLSEESDAYNVEQLLLPYVEMGTSDLKSPISLVKFVRTKDDVWKTKDWEDAGWSCTPVSY